MQSNEAFYLTFCKTVGTSLDQYDFNTIGDNIESTLDKWLYENIDGLECTYDIPLESRKALLKAIVEHMLSSDFRWGDYPR